MTGVLVRRAEVDGSVVDVRTDGRLVVEIGDGLVRRGETCLDACGAALIPGLHDHHLHLLALAAALGSTDLSSVDTLREIADSLRSAALRTGGRGWIRAVGYHERPGRGSLDRWGIDAVIPGQPVRIQHRSGALWILNSTALTLLGLDLDQSPDVERDEQGVPTGRLFRYDERLRGKLPPAPVDLSMAGAALRAVGITRVTDATPDLDGAAISLLRGAVLDGSLPAHVTLLGAPSRPSDSPLESGPAKILLADHRPLHYDDLCASISRQHEQGRAVAVHCVTRESLAATVAALSDVGSRRGDRIEHASVASQGIYKALRRLGVAVVTQPDFLRSRGDDYLREVAPADIDDLYPYASLLQAGIPVCPSSDAPFGALDPWQVMATARDRRTTAGDRINPSECVPAATALEGYLRPDPFSPPRRVAVGSSADLVLLDSPIAQVLDDPVSGHVRQVLDVPPPTAGGN